MQDYYAQENEALNEHLATTLEACLDVPRIGAMIETFAKSIRFTRFRPARHADEIQSAMVAVSDFLEGGDIESCEQSIRSSQAQGEEMAELIPLITRGYELLDLIDEGASCGFDEIYIHNVSRNQRGFLNFMTEKVIRKLK